MVATSTAATMTMTIVTATGPIAMATPASASTTAASVSAVAVPSNTSKKGRVLSPTLAISAAVLRRRWNVHGAAM